MDKKSINQLTTISELAKKFKVNKSKVNYYRETGQIPSLGTVGGIIVFDKKEAEKAMKKIIKSDTQK